jgi:hypothetical protein
VVLTKCGQRVEYAFATGMARKSPSAITLRRDLRRERRTNQRLRLLIDDFKMQAHLNRTDLDVQFTRLAQLQAEVDALKKLLEKRDRR